MTTKKKRGRPAPPRDIELCTSCGRRIKYRDGKPLPCECRK